MNFERSDEDLGQENIDNKFKAIPKNNPDLKETFKKI